MTARRKWKRVKNANAKSVKRNQAQCRLEALEAKAQALSVSEVRRLTMEMCNITNSIFRFFRRFDC